MYRILAAALVVVMTLGQASAQPGTVPPERPFTLLLITQSGNMTISSAAEMALRKMIFAPQTAQMQRWAMWATPKELAANSPITQEHHADILRDAKSLPALALVDSMTGARWHLVSGPTMPQTEYELAREFDVYFAATMEAAKTMPANAIQSVDRRAYDINRNAAFSLPVRSQSGPLPFAPNPNNGGGIFPDINLPALPDSFSTESSVNAQVDSETRSWATWIIVALVGCFIFGCCVFVGVVWLVCEAFTNQPKP